MGWTGAAADGLGSWWSDITAAMVAWGREEGVVGGRCSSHGNGLLRGCTYAAVDQ